MSSIGYSVHHCSITIAITAIAIIAATIDLSVSTCQDQSWVQSYRYCLHSKVAWPSYLPSYVGHRW